MATSEFGKAFATARKAGDKTFEFNGKKYTTKTAEDADKEKKESSNAKQRGRSDMLVSLVKAEKEAPAGTSDLAKRKIAESKRKVVEDIATADKAENMKAYKPRPSSRTRDMEFRKGGSIDGIAKSGRTHCKTY